MTCQCRLPPQHPLPQHPEQPPDPPSLKETLLKEEDGDSVLRRRRSGEEDLTELGVEQKLTSAPLLLGEDSGEDGNSCWGRMVDGQGWRLVLASLGGDIST